MHFREVNKKLNQLKTNVELAKENLEAEPLRGAAWRLLNINYYQALSDLQAFRNTTLAQLSK